MFRTLAVNCAPIHVGSKNVGKAAAEPASNEMVMRAVWLLCKCSLLVSQQNYSDLSLKVLADVVKQFNQKKSIFWKQKMWQSVKAKVDDLWATESHQLCIQMIHNICTAMVALVNGAEKMSTTKHKQLQVHLNAV
jgi:hypothetical protein